MKSLMILAALTLGTAAQAESHAMTMDHGNTPAMADAAPVTLGDLTIAGAFTRATLPNAPVAGGFLTITNAGATDDTLIGATTPAAGMTQVHEMVFSRDVMKMRELPDGLPVPAGQTVTLEPGGYHLMFMDLTQTFDEGDSVETTLMFEQAGVVTVTLPIGAPNAKGADHAGHKD